MAGSGLSLFLLQLQAVVHYLADHTQSGLPQSSLSPVTVHISSALHRALAAVFFSFSPLYYIFILYSVIATSQGLQGQGRVLSYFPYPAATKFIMVEGFLVTILWFTYRQ